MVPKARVAMVFAIMVACTTARAETPLGTAFTYQGQLLKAGEPLNEDADFRFSLWDAEVGGLQIGQTLDFENVQVENGLFVVRPDFGAAAFAGDARWLESAVRVPPEVVYTTLSPRQELTAAPYALFAANAGGMPWSGLTGVPPGFADGVDDDTQYSAGTGLLLDVTTFSLDVPYMLPQGCVDGQVAKWNAAEQIWQCADDETGSGGGEFWSLSGNAGTDPTTNFVGTTDNVPLDIRVNGAAALRLLPDPTCPNVLGGHADNDALPGVRGATVSGGGVTGAGNLVTDNYGAIGGGTHNRAGDNAGSTDERTHATVGGGFANVASGTQAAIGGGSHNAADAAYATIAGGGPSEPSDPENTRNRVLDDYGTIGGGGFNLAGSDDGDPTTARFATIGGGKNNVASRGYATVAGGGTNAAEEAGASIGGGYFNIASGPQATVAGGNSNQASGDYTFVGGGTFNAASAEYAGIAGGKNNQASAVCASVVGGYANSATAGYAAVGGGYANKATGPGATIAGGYYHQAVGAQSTVAGGNTNKANGNYSAIGGGSQNTVHGTYTVISGGTQNLVNGGLSAIGGGNDNEASSAYVTIGGGTSNAGGGWGATIGGGANNTADGEYAAIPGGLDNAAAGNRSFAAGHRAKVKAEDHGAFVWSDSSDFDFTSAGPDSFNARCTGGAQFVSAIDGQGAYAEGVLLFPGSSCWTCGSDRNRKENFAPVDTRQLLDRLAAIPIQTWKWKAQDASVRHIGPMAQDFHAAFGVGEDDTHISTIDADGVALAAIQGLCEVVREKEVEAKAQRAEIERLRARLEKLESVVADLAKRYVTPPLSP